MFKVFRKFNKFLQVDWSIKCLLMEAFIFLALGRYLKLLPFVKVAPSLGESLRETTHEKTVDEQMVKNVSYVVRIMSRHTLWESACLVQAIAATRMLNRRSIETTLYLGIARDAKGSMQAHAWVRSGNLYVTGAEVKEQFTVVNTFAKGFKDRGENVGKLQRD